MATLHERFSIRKFLLLVVMQLFLLLALFRFALPTIWARQIAAGPGPIIICFLSIHLFICFFEWWFHRYVLHATIHPRLIRFSRGHRDHHARTPIKLSDKETGLVGPGRFVLNRYPILSEEQYENAAFPPYALVVFWAIFTPLFVLFQLAVPQAPIMIGGYAAVAWSMTGYEVFHAVEHYPYEWWKRAVEAEPNASRWKKFQARWWTKLYSFHHFHHANVLANEAISGFFGFPVADWALRTCHLPKDLLLNGRIATAKEFKVKPPWPLVVWLDKWARRREAKIIHG